MLPLFTISIDINRCTTWYSQYLVEWDDLLTDVLDARLAPPRSRLQTDFSRYGKTRIIGHSLNDLSKMDFQQLLPTRSIPIPSTSTGLELSLAGRNRVEDDCKVAPAAMIIETVLTFADNNILSVAISLVIAFCCSALIPDIVLVALEAVLEALLSHPRS